MNRTAVVLCHIHFPSPSSQHSRTLSTWPDFFSGVRGSQHKQLQPCPARTLLARQKIQVIPRGKKKGKGKSSPFCKKRRKKSLTTKETTPPNPSLTLQRQSQSKLTRCKGNAVFKKCPTRKKGHFTDFPISPKECVLAQTSTGWKHKAGTRADSPWQKVLILALFIGNRGFNVEKNISLTTGLLDPPSAPGHPAQGHSWPRTFPPAVSCRSPIFPRRTIVPS